jgi:pyruvate,orthophosphate dikinase
MLGTEKRTRDVNLPQKFVYSFGGGNSDGNTTMKNILGGKGANLAEMASLGIPVPPGFTISTEICQIYYDNDKTLPLSVQESVLEALKKVESVLGKRFNDPQNPLLLSVRSGARVSMPGMMDTILNLGLNDTTVEGLAKSSGNPRFAWDSYRRFIQMYSSVVLEVNSSLLEIILEDLKAEKGVHEDTELTADDLKLLVKKFKRQVESETGDVFPSDPLEQLWGSISAVFRSWNTARAITYRQLHGYPDWWGTAVNVQAMVFGNMGDDSATGVAFTRDPSTGESVFYGEYLLNAQGEDVVAGIRTPCPLTLKSAQGTGMKSLEEALPEAFQELVAIYKRLEAHYRDMQDLEFTIEKKRLWMLQTRNGKRSAAAAVKIASDMIDEKMITEEEAILRIDPINLDKLLHPAIDPKSKAKEIAKGLPASPGAAVGEIVFSSEDAERARDQSRKVILVRIETSPEDINGMVAAEGILTTRGGMTSHAAVVARGMGRPCVAGCSDIFVDYKTKTMTAGTQVLKEGDVISIDGSTGSVILGAVKTIPPRLGPEFQKLMVLADKFRRLKVRANADTPADAKQAREFGAEGIGLCRTEHMFFDPERIDSVRKMILADNLPERIQALDELLPMQREDFMALFREMEGLPVTIRLLDPPLHEFLPHTDEEVKSLAARIKMPADKLALRVNALKEFNPMLGHRGCRLAITYPEIYRMQARAIAEAAATIVAEGKDLVPEIMIPLVVTKNELEIIRKFVEAEVLKVQEEKGVEFHFQVGTMIELPRAAVTADEIAECADFFSFGTNDLTQTTLGLSRDDSSRFLGPYVSSGIFEKDPFVSIDQKGVGFLVKTAVELGRRTRGSLKLGICGEHGGDPNSIEFFHRVGLDYVSCSPFRVPIARLSAARAALLERRTN